MHLRTYTPRQRWRNTGDTGMRGLREAPRDGVILPCHGLVTTREDTRLVRPGPQKRPRGARSATLWSRSFGRIPYARLPPRRSFVARLPEIRFEGLVGLIPPLSYSLPQRTRCLFNSAAQRRRMQTIAHRHRTCSGVPSAELRTDQHGGLTSGERDELHHLRRES